MTSTFTADFRHEFEAERTRWLRKRVLWYFGVSIIISLINLPFTLLRVFQLEPSPERQAIIVQLAMIVFSLGLYAFAFLRVRRRYMNQQSLLRLVYWIIVVGVCLPMLAFPLLMRVILVSVMETPTENVESIVSTASLMSIFIAHFIAALFIPWTPSEAVRPLVPILGLYALLTVAFSGSDLWIRAIFVAASPLAGAPGVFVAWWRHSRFRERFHYQMLRGRYGEMKRELTDARRIHESLFPAPITTGMVRFDYCYEPMRQIGGDFLFTHTFPDMELDGAPAEPVSVVIIDVTGHGIPAALTVNRIHGELDRIFAEEPDITPGEALRALNRYMHLTISRHGVYATVLCVRVEPSSDTIRWASAGHPPAFLRTIDGLIEELPATTFLLGACGGKEFDPNEQTLRFTPGDTLIAYTDGATEAMNEEGSMQRIEGMRRIVAGARPDAAPMGGWASAVLREVDRHRSGPPADDTLIIEMYRPLVVTGPSGQASERAPAARDGRAAPTSSAHSSSMTTSSDPSA